MKSTTKIFTTFLFSFLLLFSFSSHVNAACGSPKDCRLPENGTDCAVDLDCSGGRQCCMPKPCSSGTCMTPLSGYTCVAEGVCLGSEECCTLGSDKALATGGIMKGVDTNSLSGFAQLAVNIANWIQGIVGSVALLFFIYGGFVLLMSGGSSDKVTKGKQIIIGSIIGLVIVFTSYMVINFFVTSATGTNTQWNKAP